MDVLPIRNPFPGAACYLVSRTGSTQEEARSLAEGRGFVEGARAAPPPFPPGSLIAAELQSAGRGRFPERGWESEAGKNLLFTLYLEPRPVPALPIRIGAALCAAVARYARERELVFASQPRVKWPNDLMLGDRKAAGILCESGSSGTFAGVGLNCNQRAFPPGLEAKATSLARELVSEIDRWALLELFLAALKESLADSGWRAGAEALLWRRGELAAFLPGRSAGGADRAGSAVIGRIEGLDEEGSLLFEEEGGTGARAYAAGELSYGGGGRAASLRRRVDRGPPAL
jgi:BirA family biotin operon repressor/biotin-[acetyl-CoA-carboxylase] ligase